MKGSGNSYDFGARIYDPRLGRWLSIDPLAIEIPSVSTYSFAHNNPIVLVDQDGKLPIIPILIKAGASGAVDLVLQVAMNYLFDEDVQNIEQAFDKVDWAQVSLETLKGANPFRTPGGKLGKAGLEAIGEVVTAGSLAVINGQDYTIEQATQDFLLAIGAELLGDKAAEIMGNPKLRKQLAAKLDKMGIDPNSFGLELNMPKTRSFDISDVKEGQGVVYRRVDKDGNVYIGRSKSKERFLERQGEHTKKALKDTGNDPQYDFDIIGVADDGVDLRVLEETLIRENGIPNQTLQNKRYEMNKPTYKESGGTAEKQN